MSRFVLERASIAKPSATGTRTRVARVRVEYPDQLDYSGDEFSASGFFIEISHIKLHPRPSSREEAYRFDHGGRENILSCKQQLRGRELNPGLPRDRRKY